jgi:hypothetical protein
MRQAGEAEAALVEMIKRIGCVRSEITHDTAIYHDLQIAGDDAYELLVELWQRFRLSPEKKINFSKFFPNEPDALWFYWRAKLGFPDKKRPRITVGHLLTVIERGEWFEPDQSLA